LSERSNQYASNSKDQAGEPVGLATPATLAINQSGPRDIALTDGQNTLGMGQSPPPKIFHFTEFRKRRMCRGNPAQGRGAIAIVTNAGRAAVDVSYIGAKGFAGRATVSEAVARTTGVISRTAKSCGPGARSLCAKSRGDACDPTGHAHQLSAM
jgi:hypothetical protein